jgi:hypothetical protein
MLGGVLTYVLSNFDSFAPAHSASRLAHLCRSIPIDSIHRTEVWAAHGTEVRGLRTFLRQSLTKLLPIIFALIGLAVNSSLCRLIPVDAIHHGLE